MRVSLLQYAAGQNAPENLETLGRLFDDAAASRPDLVVAPEAAMYDFGEPDSPLGPAAQPLNGPFVEMLSKRARQHQTAVVAGMFEPVPDDPDRVYNTLVAIEGDGELTATYRKIHLYDSFGARESDRLVAGAAEPVVTELAGARVGLLTCYDLRFPELTRALADRGAELLVAPAAWHRGPLKEEHWTTLLRARAVENTCYVAAAAQCYPRYCGRSMLVDPMGVQLAALGEEPGTCTGELRADRLAAIRSRNPTLEHRRFDVVGREGVS